MHETPPFVCLLLLCCVSSVSGMLQVTVNDAFGQDVPACGTPSLPCASISRGLSHVDPFGVVLVSPGTYRGAFNCNLTVTQPVIIRSISGPAVTTIDCQRQSRCLSLYADTTLEGLTLRNGWVHFRNDSHKARYTMKYRGSQSPKLPQTELLQKQNFSIFQTEQPTDSDPKRCIHCPRGHNLKFSESASHPPSLLTNSSFVAMLLEVAQAIMRTKDHSALEMLCDQLSSADNWTRQRPNSSTPHRKTTWTTRTQQGASVVPLRVRRHRLPDKLARGFGRKPRNSKADDRENFHLDWVGGAVLVLRATVEIVNTTIVGGRASFGGGLGCINSTVRSVDSQFVSNTGNNGGGIYVWGGQMNLDSAFLSQNIGIPAGKTSNALDHWNLGAGGAVFVLEASLFMSACFVEGSRVQSSKMSFVQGSALFFKKCYNIAITSTMVVNSTAQSPSAIYGGAIFVLKCDNVLVVSSTVANSSTRSSGRITGGGLYFFDCANVTIVSSLVVNTTAQSDAADVFGGAMNGHTVKKMSIRSSMIIGTTSLTHDGHIAGGALNLFNANFSLVKSIAASTTTRSQHGWIDGGCLRFVNGQSIAVISSTITNTTADSLGGDHIRGGGVFVAGSVGVGFRDTSIVGNTATLHSFTESRGGGLYSQGNHALSLTSCVVAANRALGLGVAQRQAEPDCSFLRSNLKWESRSSQSLSACSGILSGVDPYPDNHQQQWTILLSQVSLSVHLHFFMLDTESVEHCYDVLSLYDGATTASPLLGKYCGTLQRTRCLDGPCPNLTSITLSGAAATIVFSSDPSVHHQGFGLSWNTTTQVGQPPSLFVPTSGVFDTGSSGGGIFSADIGLSLQNVSIHENKVRGSLQAAGGGLVVWGEATVESCTIRNNAASANDDCFYNVLASTFMCAQAVGGGLVVDTFGSLFARQSAIHENSAHCNRPFCTSSGAGLWVGENADLVQGRQLDIRGNRIFCSGERCFGTGGGIHLAQNARPGDRRLHTFALSEISNNSVAAFISSQSAGGGGLFASTSTRLVLKGVGISRNDAPTGAGALLDGFSTTVIEACALHDNVGFIEGGGLVVRSVSIVLATKSVFRDNTAPLGPQVFTAGSPSLTLQSSAVLGGANMGSSTTLPLVLLSTVRFPFQNGSLLNCLSNGTVISAYATVREDGGRFMTYDCRRCEPGMYKTSQGILQFQDDEEVGGDKSCFTCPAIGRCYGGHDIRATQHHWGRSDSTGVITFHRCPPGYCCDNDVCSPFHFCTSNRAGRLCGSCRDGFSETVGAVGCSPNSECHHLSSILSVIAAISGVVSATFMFMHHRIATQMHTNQFQGFDDEGVVKGTIFFFQIVPLVTAQTETSAFLAVVLNLLNLEIGSSPSGSGGGLCPFPGFTAVAKIASRYIIPFLLLLWVLVGAVCRAAFQLRRDTNTRHYRGYGAFVGAIFQIFGLGYSTMVKTTFQLLQCVPLADHLVLFSAAYVECYEAWQLALLSLVLPVLLLYPVLLFFLVRKSRRAPSHPPGPSVSMRCILGVISKPYTTATEQWEAVLMLQRLVLITVSTFVTSPLWRAWVLVILLTCMLVLQLSFMPFKRPLANRLMALFLCFLLLIGAWEVGMAVYSAKGLVLERDLRTHSGGIFAFMTLTPLCLGVLFRMQGLLGTVVAKLRSRKRHSPNSNSEGNILEVQDGAQPARSLDACAVCQTLSTNIELDVSDTPTMFVCEDHVMC